MTLTGVNTWTAAVHTRPTVLTPVVVRVGHSVGDIHQARGAHAANCRARAGWHHGLAFRRVRVRVNIFAYACAVAGC